MGTVLQFQKQIPSSKNELIFQFSAISNVVERTHEGKTTCIQKFRGDVVVNLTTQKCFLSEKARISLISDIHGEMYEKYLSENLTIEEKIDFVTTKCEEEIEKMLFEECEKLSKVIC